jgi:hypothetical protein
LLVGRGDSRAVIRDTRGEEAPRAASFARASTAWITLRVEVKRYEGYIRSGKEGTNMRKCGGEIFRKIFSSMVRKDHSKQRMELKCLATVSIKVIDIITKTIPGPHSKPLARHRSAPTGRRSVLGGKS